MIDRIIDLLFRLIPGSRLNPDSLEGRARRAAARSTRKVAAAIDQEARIQASVQSSAVRAISASEAAIAEHEARLQRLVRIGAVA